MRTRVPLGVIVATVSLTAFACGGSDSPTTPSPSPSPGGDGGTAAATITIANNAVSPRSVTVSAGSRINFVNSDSRAHEMASDPHPAHTECPELNQVGFLNPGQSRQTGALNTRRTCSYHDHINESNGALQGSITIQ